MQHTPELDSENACDISVQIVPVLTVPFRSDAVQIIVIVKYSSTCGMNISDSLAVMILSLHTVCHDNKKGSRGQFLEMKSIGELFIIYVQYLF